MTSALKSIGDFFTGAVGGMSTLIGGNDIKKPREIADIPEIQNYDPNKHGKDVVQIKRNPGLLGKPGTEDLMTKWDADMSRFKASYQAMDDARRLMVKTMRGKGEGSSANVRAYQRAKDRAVSDYYNIMDLEAKIAGNLYRAPAGYTPATPAAAPKPAAPAAPKPAQPSVKPTPAVATPAGNIAGTTQITGTETGAGGGGRRRRGRVQTLFGNLGGESERLGN